MTNEAKRAIDMLKYINKEFCDNESDNVTFAITSINQREEAIAFAQSKRSLIRNGKLNAKSTIAERTGMAIMLTEILEILEGEL